MADQVILKHIREAVGAIPLNQLEIEVRLNKALSTAAFNELDAYLAQGKWEGVTQTESVDTTVGDVRVTDGKSAIRKSRITTTNVGAFRVVTSQEQPVPVPPPPPPGQGFTRRKRRTERTHWGWKLALTTVDGSTHEVEIELDWLFLVRRPYDKLAEAGAQLMEDVSSFLDRAS